MGQKAITIYTPSTADPHITADDDAFIYQSPYSIKSGIIGDMTCTKVNNNTIRLSSGGVMNRGHVLRIPDGENLDLTVETGATGYKRYDSVVAEFVKGGGNDADTYEIKIVKGMATTGTPTPPTMIYSNLSAKNNVNQIELFRLYINETTLSTITQIIETLPTITKITYGISNPSGGNDGDVYLRTAGNSSSSSDGASSGTAIISDGDIDIKKLSIALQRPSNVIDSGTISEMLWCAESYFNYAYTGTNQASNLLYKTGTGLYSESLGNGVNFLDENGNQIYDSSEESKYGIVCSSFVEAVINGITFENSRYNGNINNIRQSWGVMFDDTVQFGRTSTQSTKEVENRYLTSQSLAKYAEEHGYLYTINDSKNIRAGDVLFSGNESGRYLGINHCVIAVNVSNEYVSVIEAWDKSTKTDGKLVGLRINKRLISGFTYGATFPIGSVNNSTILMETISKSQFETNSSSGYSTLCSFSRTVDKGFYTVVCHGVFPSSPYVVITYSGDNSPTGQGSMHRIGNDCYLTFYAQKSGVVEIVVDNDGKTYTPDEMSLYHGYAEISSFANLMTELVSGDNLNDCKMGIFYCRSAAAAQNITNAPLGNNAFSGFRIECIKMSNKERYMQTLWYIGNPETQYVRHYYIPDSSNSAIWGNWYAYSGTLVT